MALCIIGVLFVMGLRTPYTGSPDTGKYVRLFETIQEYSSFKECFASSLEKQLLLSEIGFNLYTWCASRIFIHSQWFLFLTSAIIVGCTAHFIRKHSADYTVSWIVFICLGSMTFSMNGMRQALAMSICLLAYDFAVRRKFFRFLLIVFIAVLFHKSAMFFVIVYFAKNMKLNVKSAAVLIGSALVAIVFSDEMAVVYDNLTGEDYATGESFEGGGLVAILIYLIAIALYFFLSKNLKDPEKFYPLALCVIGLTFFLLRYASTQIFERISYYFAYFLMLVFANIFKETEHQIKFPIRLCFFVCCVLLFWYRTTGGTFSDYALFWNGG